MENVRRFKYFMIATIVCVVLLCAALISVSFAAWTVGGDSASVDVKSSASKFYVEYPQYTVVSGDNEVVIPQLNKDKYYLQVPQRGNIGMSDYYEFEAHETEQVKLRSVYLYPGDVLDLFYGKAKIEDEELLENDVGYQNLTVSGSQCSVNSGKEGFYDFYYNFVNNTLWTVYIGKPDEGNGGSTEQTFDVSGYSNPITIKFSDGTSTLYFRAGADSGTYSNVANLHMHIWSGSTTYLANTLISSVASTLEVKVAKSSAKFQLNFSGDWGTQSNGVLFSGYAKNDINCITVHSKANTDPSWDKGGSGTVQNGGSSTNEANNRTAAEADYVGSTSFVATATQKLAGEKAVRKANAVVQSASNKYVYQNYISISRKSSETTTEDNSIAFLEFEVKMPQGSAISPYDVVVDSVTLNRRETDANGNITSKYMNPAPRIYNYDPTVETRLGPHSDDNVPDYDGKKGRLPIFAHGNKHIVTGDDGSSSEVSDHMKDHYDDGAYVILFFGDNNQQYFALDIEIEFSLASGVTAPEGDVTFELTVNASNKNNWDRYDTGFGEPWGFYMGGLINSVKTWEPTRSAKLERASTDYVTSYDEAEEKKALGNKTIDDMNEAAAKAAIEEFNKNKAFNYKLVDYWHNDANNNYVREGYARYPKGKIDVSLTINLIEDSRIKIYMLDNIGSRLDIEDANGNITSKNRTIYVVPNEIKCDKATEALFKDHTYDVFDDDLNIIIPKTGTYVFRLSGYFHTGDEEVNGKKGTLFNYATGERCEDLDGAPGKGLDNFNLIVDKLYVTCASEGNSDCEITLKANGGKFDGNVEEITRTLTFGSSLSKLPQPTYGNKKLVGWYYEEDGNIIEVGLSSTVTGNMTLFARWDNTSVITFDANEGSYEAGQSNTITTDADGIISPDDWASFNPPVRSGYELTGWSRTRDGDVIDVLNTTFDGATTLYAQWNKNNYAITFHYNYDEAPNNGVYATQATMPTDPELVGHTFGGWYENASCTGSQYDFSQTLSGNKELYAEWTGASYQIVGGNMVALTAGSGTDNPFTGTIEMRTGKTGAIAVGSTIKVYYNGKLLSELDEINARVEHNGTSFTLGSSAQSAKSQGKFTVKAHVSGSGATAKNTVDIKFVGGDAADQIGSEISASAANAGYYVVGQFSDWKIYAANKMSECDFKGVQYAKLDFVIPNSQYEKYQIVHVQSGKIVWYGGSGNSDNSSNTDMTVLDTAFYFDTYNIEAYAYTAGHDTSYTYNPFLTSDYINTHVRFVYDTQGQISGADLNKFYIHYWASSSSLGTTTWPGKRMARLNGSSSWYVHDAQLGNGATAIRNIIINNDGGDSGVKSNDSACTVQYGKTYKVTGESGKLNYWSGWTAQVNLMS